MNRGFLSGLGTLFLLSVQVALGAKNDDDGSLVVTEEELAKCTVKLALSGTHLLAFAEVAAFIGALAVLAWGVALLWNRESPYKFRYDLHIALVAISGTLLLAFTEVIVPLFTKGSIYTAFGTSLPAPTMILRDHHHIALAVPVLCAFAAWKLYRHPKKIAIYAALTATQYAVLCLALWAFYIPVFVSC